MRELRFLGTLLRVNLKACFAHRLSFWMQAGLMLFNNLVFCLTWFLFFHRYDEINGWRLPDLLALYGIVALSFGACLVVGGGVRELSYRIRDGDLDTYLTQPRNPLLQVVASRTYASGWGDMASGFILLGMSGYLEPARLPLILVMGTCGALILIASAILIHSLVFWIGSLHEFARQVFLYTVTFSVYPQNIYNGVMRVILFTVLPAGFIGYLPVLLLQDFQWDVLAVLCAATVGYVWLADRVFRWGLRRYTSGNRITVRV